ncbi:ABC transporter substrate-binding protein [Paenibacillaceae bacterium WGS1546]|uniref:ABC transporter substrate-binding protein n=1 Tax=Cohnella sp. WGS1546 TaxID=3366810 RepID=UPI00372D3DC3
MVAVALTTACGAKENGNNLNAEPAAPVKIKVADILNNPVLRVAKTEGFLDRYGIDAEIVTFATPAEGINSLFIKQVDIAWGADFPILNAVSKGDYSVIAATGTDSDRAAAEWRLFVRDDIRSGADLKGKKLSTLRGTFLPYLWDEYLKENGIEEIDTQQIGQGGFDEAYVALKKGEIDASWIVGAVLTDKFRALEGVHELTDMSKTTVRLGGGIVAPDSLIKEHPQAIANFLRALDDASQFIQANPDKTADILYKEVKQPKEATIRDIPTNNWAIGFKQESYDSLAGQKKYMVEAGIIEKDFDLTEKLYLDGIREAFPDRVTYAP